MFGVLPISRHGRAVQPDRNAIGNVSLSRHDSIARPLPPWSRRPWRHPRSSETDYSGTFLAQQPDREHARWFGNAGQKSLNQRVHEGEESLLRQLDAPDLTSEAIETRGNSLLRGFHLAFASGQLSLNRRANERARIREASRLRRALNAT